MTTHSSSSEADGKANGCLVVVLVLISVVGLGFLGLHVLVALVWHFGAPHYPEPRSVLVPFIQRTKPLIEAIKSFEVDHGSPPATLEELVPDYLDNVPETGLEKCPKYEYVRFDAKRAKATLIWYDLGSRNGEGMTGLWVYPEGDPENAILAIPLDGDDIAEGASTDRMPANVKSIPFDSDRWRNDVSCRIAMVRSLAGRINGKNRSDIIAMLGEPDGDFVTSETPWQLSVQYTWSWLDPGKFIYWPTEKYPLEHWGRSTKVEEWVFLHF